MQEHAIQLQLQLNLPHAHNESCVRENHQTRVDVKQSWTVWDANPLRISDKQENKTTKKSCKWVLNTLQYELYLYIYFF